MPAAAMVVVPEVGALGFDGPVVPAVGRLPWTLRFGGLVVVLVDVGVEAEGDCVFALDVAPRADWLVPVDVGVDVAVLVP